MDTRFQLNRGDAVEWLRTLASSSVDLLITDPPYESLEKHRAIGTTTRLKHSKSSSNNWFSIFHNDRFPELFREVHRVLKRDAHFYLYCDPETMFVAKPKAEEAGFKFWKPIIWDKCLGPETLVWTERGVVKISEIVVGDRVASPEGGAIKVRATRKTRALALRLALSDGSELIASREHRFMRGDGALVEACELRVGQALCTRPVRFRPGIALQIASPLEVVGVEPMGERELVDISVAAADELFLLANGAVTHNCKIGMGYHYRARYECILFFEKGKRKLNDLGVADVLQFPRVFNGYPAEKPVEVSEILVRQSSEPGQLVVDPFMGSGSVGVAAAKLGRSFAGSDLCDEAIDITRRRLVDLGASDVADLYPLQQQGALL